MLAHKVVFKALIQCCHLLHCLIQPANCSRQRVAEQAADASRNINAWTLQLIERNNLYACHLQGSLLPNRTHAHQAHKFRHTLTIRAHVIGCPQQNAHAFRITAFFRHEFVNHILRHLRTNLPRYRCRQQLRINAVKIASGRQNLGTSARRRTAGTRLNIF